MVVGGTPLAHGGVDGVEDVVCILLCAGGDGCCESEIG